MPCASLRECVVAVSLFELQLSRCHLDDDDFARKLRVRARKAYKSLTDDMFYVQNNICERATSEPSMPQSKFIVSGIRFCAQGPKNYALCEQNMGMIWTQYIWFWMC